MFAVNIIFRIIFDLLPVRLSDPYGSASLPSTSNFLENSSAAKKPDSRAELFTPANQNEDSDTCLAGAIPGDNTNPLACETDSVSELSDATTTFSSDEDSDTCSIVSSATSEDLANERVECMLTDDTNLPIIEPDHHSQQGGSQTKSGSENYEAPPPPSVYVASAVPRRVYGEWDGRHEPKQVVPQWVDDIDADDNYDARYLSPRARDEAERRSLDIWRSARMTARDLAKVVPLKAHEHPEPRSRRSPSVLKDLGHSSSLQMSWTVDDLEEEMIKKTVVQRSWANEEDDVLEDLCDLNRFFNMRT